MATYVVRKCKPRRAFYLREGGLLLWVFKSFDMGDARLTQGDIYNNNRNSFVVSQETLEASRRAELANR